MSYTLLVEFTVKQEAFPEFVSLVQANAETSLHEERGCQRFDVLIPENECDRVVLYEIYDDEAAFRAHCDASHFAAFTAATRDMVRDKTVTHFVPGGAPVQAAAASGNPSPAPALAEDDRVVDADALAAFARELFARVGLPAEDAALVAESLVLADLRGMQSHGVLRIPIYVEKIRAGGFQPGTRGRIVRETPGTVLLDGEDGLGQVLTLAAMDSAMAKARETGIGAAGVLNSNHYGEAAYYVMHAARRDMIGIVATNGSPNMPAWGGTTKMTGPLPFTAAVPTLEERPFVLDAALGATNRGKLIYLAEKGEKIPLGWGVDSEARPTDDPGKVLDGGWILPIGGHKGFGITMFIEILSGVLTGALVGSEIRDLYNAGRDRPQGLGHFCIAIDPGAFMPVEDFKRRMDAMIRMVKASRLAPGVDRMTIPGEPEFDTEAVRRRDGIPLARSVLERLNELARELGAPHAI